MIISEQIKDVRKQSTVESNLDLRSGKRRRRRRSTQTEELLDVYSMSNAIRKTKSRAMEQVRLVVEVGQRGTEYGTLVGEPEGKNILYDLNADGNIIVKWKRKGQNILRGVGGLLETDGLNYQKEKSSLVHTKPSFFVFSVPVEGRDRTSL